MGDVVENAMSYIFKAREDIPIHVDNCPISEAVVEIRFEKKLDEDIFFAQAYKLFHKDHPEVVKLPLAQLPSEVREGDENLLYKPIYRLTSENSMIQFGSQVFSFVVKDPYPGWREVESSFMSQYKHLRKEGMIGDISRLGLRYINRFPYPLWDKLELDISHMKEAFRPATMQLVADVKRDQFSNRVLIGWTEGSAEIDIDTNRSGLGELSQKSFKRLLKDAHTCEKSVFFSLLTKDFIDTLNPTY